ncbi:non-structural maintenance of chromosomes element 4 homolog A, partial [Tanacetum coccineum]
METSVVVEEASIGREDLKDCLGSVVLLMGSLSVGLCRHRALRFKLTSIELTFIRLMEVGMLLSGRVRIVVSHVFDKGDGCCTMLRPVNSKVHQLTCVLFWFVVQKHREQVANAEAFVDITNTLVTFVKAQINEGVTVTDFMSSLLKGFGRLGGRHDGTDGSRNVAKWKKLRIVVSHVFYKGDGCCTVHGPMNSEVKQRK